MGLLARQLEKGLTKNIGKALAIKDEHHIVVVKSTVVPEQKISWRGEETMAIEYKDEKIIEKALGILEREMSLVDYTRFLQLIGPTEGDATRELMEKRKRYGVDEAYEIFKDRVKKRY